MNRKDKMYAVVQAWNGSELTRAEFARQHGISVTTLDNWRARFAQSPESTAKNEPDFIELHLSDTSQSEPAATPKVRLELPHGIVLKIY